MIAREGKHWISTRQRIWNCRIVFQQNPFFTVRFQNTCPFFTDSSAWTFSKNRLEQNHDLVWDPAVSKRSCFQCPKLDLTQTSSNGSNTVMSHQVFFFGNIHFDTLPPGYGVAFFLLLRTFIFFFWLFLFSDLLSSFLLLTLPTSFCSIRPCCRKFDF